MTNTSATGGFLQPTSTYAAPLEDGALDDFIQAIVVGITGLDGTMVRPRWQTEPPNLPARTVDWAAVGVPTRKADTFAVEQHDPDGSNGDGSDIVIRHEELQVLCSFYGPNCNANAVLLRDGLAVAQNREALRAGGMALVSTGDPTKAPEVIKTQWYPRCDLEVTIRRQIQREYPVLNIRTAVVTVQPSDAVSPASITADGGQFLQLDDPDNSGVVPANL